MSQPFGLDSKRWVQRASAVPFGELAAVRATAGQWRNGLAGLTALLSANSLIASPTLADHLGSGTRLAVGAIAIAGLLVLLFGTWRTMDAAFGGPGADDYLTGERLRTWEQEQARGRCRRAGHRPPGLPARIAAQHRGRGHRLLLRSGVVHRTPAPDGLRGSACASTPVVNPRYGRCQCQCWLRSLSSA
jgi:hypothetical protein